MCCKHRSITKKLKCAIVVSLQRFETGINESCLEITQTIRIEDKSWVAEWQ